MSTPPEPVELTCEGLLSGRSDKIHFLGYCPDCDAYQVAYMTLEQVEDKYHHGMIDQDVYEGYCWVWATDAVRFGSYDHWRIPPAVESGRLAGERIRVARAYRRARAALP